MKNKLLLDALALFLITLISGFGLSYIYEITKEPIAIQVEEKTLKANQSVFPDASTFEEDTELTALLEGTDLVSLNADYTGVTIDTISKAFSSSNELLGYNITVSTSAGYKNGIQIVFGFAKDGTVKGVEFLAINETAGLGMNAAQPAFKDQYVGRQVQHFVVTKTGAASEDQIDAISGATITSRAVTNAINAGIQFVTTNSTELGGGQ